MTKMEILEGIKSSLAAEDDFAEELYGDFLEMFQKTFQDASSAINEKDAASLRQAAHTLKGCAANLGAEAIRVLAYDLQRAAESKDFSTCSTLLKSLAEQNPEGAETK